MRAKRAARDENVPAKRADFFHIASYQIFKNGVILINHRSIFQGKDSLQLDRFQFLEINSLMAETTKKQFFKTKFL